MPSLEFDSLDKTLKEGEKRVKISKVGEIVRKLAEIKLATDLLQEIGENNIIVRDGDLETVTEIEQEYLQKLNGRQEKDWKQKARSLQTELADVKIYVKKAEQRPDSSPD